MSEAPGPVLLGMDSLDKMLLWTKYHKLNLGWP